MEINTHMAGPSHFLNRAAGVRCMGGGGSGGGGGTIWPPLGAGIVRDIALCAALLCQQRHDLSAPVVRAGAHTQLSI